MEIVKFGDVVKDVKINVDRNNNPYDYYVAGDHMDSEDLTIRRKGSFATDDVGPAFTRIFKRGQVLYGSRRTYLKKVAVADFEGICANTTFVFESKDESVLLQELLPFVMMSDDFTDWSIKHSKGSTNPYVLFSDLANYKFSLPPIAEQRILADKLWAAYRLKESYKELIKATDELVKSQFIEMFGNPLDIQQSESCKTVSSSCNIVSGYPFSAELFSDSKENGKPLIRIRDVARGFTETYTSEDCDTKYIVKKGDLLIGMDGMFDICPWQSEEALLNQRVCMIGPKNNEVSKGFLIHSIRPVLKNIENLTNATTVKHLSVSQIGKIKLPVFTKDDSDRFNDIYQQADKSKFELQKSIEAIDQVIKSLINR